MTPGTRSDHHDLLVALRHPLRRQILRAIAKGKALSPRELSVSLDEPLSNVSYHVRVLADRGAVALVETQPVRGSVQHFYRADVEAPWARQVLGLNDGEGGPGESSGDPAT
jgi:DNA-binding transcriptional ArsR family regulator